MHRPTHSRKRRQGAGCSEKGVGVGRQRLISCQVIACGGVGRGSGNRLLASANLGRSAERINQEGVDLRIFA
jgi:hypothetical protein